MPYDSDFDAMERLAATFRRAEARDDFNNEMAGRDVGRIARFLPGEASPQLEARKRRERLGTFIMETALQSLLADPVYRKRWEEFGTFLETYSAAAQTALERAMEASTAARDAVRDALENAHTLDGQPVFETDDGRYVYADGAEIDPGEAGDIAFSGDAVSYEDYQALEKSAAEAEQAVKDIKDFQGKLNAAEAKRNDPDNPYKSPEEMDAEKRRLEENAPASVREILNDPAMKYESTGSSVGSPSEAVKPAV